ncbi:outer membrane protein assembly factor BamD [Methylophilus medardicus]|uniref:Outer membrane protein assembly factor BamD n=1 Tax=Methylophilus medardicus TaxID=2588534 RepID=A0A5B8CSC0_9PROT|nr:outer membrane protein assembly factor BamD [Methylophilus medardicus]QDC44030.1 outer membrane protein assembly factor BamD [Methylophilus medardicus]QDC49037.1 outer membrane protein assembly factor BamD [Methylophilus medardicus]QDC52742.1 outer membrane protein assembly factor BamD [Methylophilus medardicus]
MPRILPLNTLFTRAFILITALALSACAIFGNPNPPDETKGWAEQRLYAAGQEKMVDKNFDKAIDYFKKLEARYPHGVYATQSQLEVAYAYFKKSEPVLCLAAVDRFIKLHPNHPNLDYAYYLKGLATFNERGIIEKYTKQEINDRDPKTLRVSFNAFKELVERFPNSRYAKDATQRMIYLVNTLAMHEMHVARYYMQRKAYVAALNRTRYVLETYPNSSSVEDALVTMVSAYDAMDLTDLKNDTLRILKTNYPENPMISGKINEDEKIWWKFWESLY